CSGVVADCHGVTQNGSGSSSVTSPALETTNESVCGATVVSTKLDDLLSRIARPEGLVSLHLHPYRTICKNCAAKMMLLEELRSPLLEDFRAEESSHSSFPAPPRIGIWHMHPSCLERLASFSCAVPPSPPKKLFSLAQLLVDASFSLLLSCLSADRFPWRISGAGTAPLACDSISHSGARRHIKPIKLCFVSATDSQAPSRGFPGDGAGGAVMGLHGPQLAHSLPALQACGGGGWRGLGAWTCRRSSDKLPRFKVCTVTVGLQEWSSWGIFEPCEIIWESQTKEGEGGRGEREGGVFDRRRTHLSNRKGHLFHCVYDRNESPGTSAFGLDGLSQNTTRNLYNSMTRPPSRVSWRPNAILRETKPKANVEMEVHTMTGNPVDCTVKSPVALQIGDVVSDSFRPGVYITDVVLGEPVNIQEMSFKNSYTAYLTVRVLRKEVGSEDGTAKWVTCLRNHCLMANPHTEEGSQDYFSIYRQQMLTQPDNVTTVRLIQRQPSSVWLGFGIEEIKIYPLVHEDTERDVPSWLSTITPVEEPLDLNGLPDPDEVSSNIQQMWALTEIMQSSQTSASIGRFDVSLGFKAVAKIELRSVRSLDDECMSGPLIYLSFELHASPAAAALPKNLVEDLLYPQTSKNLKAVVTVAAHEA
ncbi:hypothetical protein NFI96_022773, partial [Prochilodus magdalenae]